MLSTVLAIESSCDETAAAVIKDGNAALSNVVASQIEIHREFGGVVPELASRKHVEAIIPVIEKALRNAQVELTDIDGIAVTQAPALSVLSWLGFPRQRRSLTPSEFRL